MNKYHYPSTYSKKNDAVCGVTVYHYKDKNILIVSELLENQGTSVTNRADWLHRQLCQNYDLDPKETIFIEHYGPRILEKMNTYDQIIFSISPTGDFSQPGWTRLEPSEVAALIGDEPPSL